MSRALPQSPESALVHDVIRYLRNVAKCVAWRNQSGVIPLIGPTGKRRAIHMSEKGLPDVVGVLPGGRCIAVECKRQGNAPTALQAFMLNELRERGALVVVAYSVEDVMRALASSS